VNLDADRVQNCHSDRAGRPIQAGDKFDRAGRTMRVDVPFLNERRRDADKLDAELHGQRPNGRLSAAISDRGGPPDLVGRPIYTMRRPQLQCAASTPSVLYQLVYDQK
jgi:hypothetical protein